VRYIHAASCSYATRAALSREATGRSLCSPPVIARKSQINSGYMRADPAFYATLQNGIRGIVCDHRAGDRGHRGRALALERRTLRNGFDQSRRAARHACVAIGCEVASPRPLLSAGDYDELPSMLLLMILTPAAIRRGTARR
jgi:hypothetical protein